MKNLRDKIVIEGCSPEMTAAIEKRLDAELGERTKRISGPYGRLDALISRTITVSPAYGRDYKTAKAAKAAFLDGKDFLGHFFGDGPELKPCGVSDFVPGIDVIIRFCENRKLTKVRVPKAVAS